MGVVHLFESRKTDSDKAETTEQAANCNRESAEVVKLIFNKAVSSGIPANPIYRQMEALMISHGVDFNCDKTKEDYKVLTYLLQGMMDRVDGAVTSDRCMMLDSLRLAIAYEEPLPNDTNEVFGDLLGRFDSIDD